MEWLRTNTRVIPDSRVRSVLCCMFGCGVKPSRKVTCVNTEESIMEGHMHEHGPLYSRVPFVMFDEGGWWCGVVVLVFLLLFVLLLVRRIALPFQLWLCP